jgi:hypothetical protein
MVVAVVALSLAVGGTAIAGPGAISEKITKSKVKKIAKKQGKKQANKLLNKRESGLNVASAVDATNATNATNAANADNAAAVNGVSLAKVSLHMPAGTPDQTMFSGNGLTMLAGCSGGSALSITATTSVDANFGAVLTNYNAPDPNTGVSQTQVQFNPGDAPVDVIGGGSANGAQIEFQYDGNNNAAITGTLITDNFVGGGCRVAGTVINAG